ncbi:hypothetical protein AB0L71_22805 [Streptomyces sp. NPDC052052]|uniref:hypothetical protein n=1 Tax=Streptomyces sp. NPDC052052 TaxID=3154756 RepID=UPI003429610F
MICIDCDRVITGPYATVAHGTSMSGAREDMYAHPPGSPACKPTPRSGKARLRRALDRDARPL